MTITLLIAGEAGDMGDFVHINYDDVVSIPRTGDVLDTHHGLFVVTHVVWDIDTAPDRPKAINGVTIHTRKDH